MWDGPILRSRARSSKAWLVMASPGAAVTTTWSIGNGLSAVGLRQTVEDGVDLADQLAVGVVGRLPEGGQDGLHGVVGGVGELLDLGQDALGLAAEHLGQQPVQV